MTTGTNIKDRCRLCYTRLKDSSTSHHKLWCAQHNHQIYNIYKRRPYRYRDLIVRYLCIRLPENEITSNGNDPTDRYSHVVCGTCAASLNKLDAAFRTFQQTQKVLRSKFRKTSHIVHYQLNKQLKNYSSEKSSYENPQGKPPERIEQNQDKDNVPKRQSKRKGAPKHIDQTMNNSLTLKKPTGSMQLIVKIHSPDRQGDDDESEDNEGDDDLQDTSSSSPTKRTSPRRKSFQISEPDKTNPKKKFKRLTKDQNASNNERYNCVNLLKPNILTDIPLSSNPKTRPNSLSSNSRPINSVKGNHIERIAVSLRSGTEALSDIGNNTLNLLNGTTDHHSIKTRGGGRRKQSSTLEVSTTNNILSSTVPSPSFDDSMNGNDRDDDDDDDDEYSIGGASNASSNTSTTVVNRQVNANIPNVNKNLPTSISTTPTAEGLTITAINQTGQKQVFMAKQLGNLKKYQCGLCEKIVTNIQIHVRRHTNDKPYPCTYCEKRFTNSGDLQIHVRIHTGEKPYACPLCLKSYRTIGNFNSHVKTHDSGIRPHRCDLCNQTFPIPKDWYSHLRSSHRSRTANINNNSITSSSSSSLNSTNTTTTVTQPLFASNSVTSQQQNSERFTPNKVKLEPINRSQLQIKSSNDKASPSEDDDQEPVDMSTRDDSNGEDDDEVDEGEEENHQQSTHNLLANVSSPVHA
ncbi:unnamed protein product [Adineta ricciae]|uniref:C2H2-type domain-containing protein n=1 Tax=Adineta ricciae TaxID=249248 RepID=A0A813VS89_ADIRI|nr:unnamed protein product [Adineta ricciae]CAF0929135.1 unnamed protein product [Adineta ricciae]